MDFNKSIEKFSDYISEAFSDEVKKGIALGLSVILFFGAGNAIGSLTNFDKAQPADAVSTQANSTEPQTDSATVSQTQAQTQQTTAAPVTSAPESTNATTAPSESQGNTQQNVQSGTLSTPAEIIAYFNESANKIKTDATKVVKNFEKRTHNEDKLILPSSLQSLANSLMAESFKDDTEPIEYSTKEDITANYQVPGQTYVSQLTEAEVSEAACTDNGSEYEITLKLHPTVNPEPGTGVAKAVDTITASEVQENAPSMVKGFDTEYYDCVVKCKIDKATGRTTWSSYTTPVVLKLKVEIPIAGVLDAQIGMTFEKDYTITY